VIVDGGLERIGDDLHVGTREHVAIPRCDACAARERRGGCDRGRERPQVDEFGEHVASRHGLPDAARAVASAF
jgi:hypothetical protein